MEHSQVVIQSLLPSDKQPSEPVQPAVGALDYPTSRAVPRKGLYIYPLLSSAADVRCVSVSSHQPLDFRKVIRFVHTQVLKLPRLGHWPIRHHSFKCRLNQFHVVAVGSIRTHPYGNTLSFSQQAAFGSLLASVCRIRASTLTPQAEPWSWLHPSLATPNLGHALCRILLTRVAIESRRYQRLAKAETDHAQCSVPRIPEAKLSTGSRCASRRRSHPYTGGRVSKACRLSHAGPR